MSQDQTSWTEMTDVIDAKKKVHVNTYIAQRWTATHGEFRVNLFLSENCVVAAATILGMDLWMWPQPWAV